MNTLFMKNIVKPIQSNPTLGAAVGTGALCVFTWWWYASSTRNTLVRTQATCRQISSEAFQDCREMLKKCESHWDADVRSRDTQVRRLELQNVEQTRSVGRLEAAMKMCLVQNS